MGRMIEPLPGMGDVLRPAGRHGDPPQSGSILPPKAVYVGRGSMAHHDRRTAFIPTREGE